MTEHTITWTVLAHLLRPQGRKGELLAELLTDFPESFRDRPVFLAAPDFRGTKDQARPAEIASFWLPTGRNQGRIVLHLAGVESISAAELLVGFDVVVPEEDRQPLEEGATYVSDLVGSEVFDGTTRLGVLREVQFPANADGSRRLDEAAPLLSVESDAGDEILIPFVKAYLVAIDPQAKRIVMTLPEGLTEINRSQQNDQKR